jgi:hypothetical protein
MIFAHHRWRTESDAMVEQPLGVAAVAQTEFWRLIVTRILTRHSARAHTTPTAQASERNGDWMSGSSGQLLVEIKLRTLLRHGRIVQMTIAAARR